MHADNNNDQMYHWLLLQRKPHTHPHFNILRIEQSTKKRASMTLGSRSTNHCARSAYWRSLCWSWPQTPTSGSWHYNVLNVLTFMQIKTGRDSKSSDTHLHRIRRQQKVAYKRIFKEYQYKMLTNVHTHERVLQATRKGLVWSDIKMFCMYLVWILESWSPNWTARHYSQSKCSPINRPQVQKSVVWFGFSVQSMDLAPWWFYASAIGMLGTSIVYQKPCACYCSMHNAWNMIHPPFWWNLMFRVPMRHPWQLTA